MGLSPLYAQNKDEARWPPRFSGHCMIPEADGDMPVGPSCSFIKFLYHGLVWVSILNNLLLTTQK